jgi:hypothetical protein
MRCALLTYSAVSPQKYVFRQLRDSLMRTITDSNPSATLNFHAYAERVALDSIASAGL